MLKTIKIIITLCCLTVSVFTHAGDKIKALIIDGQNNHGVWPMSTMMMKKYLEETGLFTVDIERTSFTWQGGDLIKKYPLNDGKTYEVVKEPQTDNNFAPNFFNYQVVISNFGWKAADWSQATQQALESYMKNGGGLVVVHAANNSFPQWLEYNRMIALGGWGNRNEKDGPYVYFNDQEELIHDTSKGNGGGHGKKHEFQVQNREPNHPIMKGIPPLWMHTYDELYSKLRGPAENLTILASAYDNEKTHRHEPILMTIDYHKGRIFHTTLGHAQAAFESVGFILTFQRGTQWAATGKVTIPVPADFPTAEQSSSRKFN